MNPELEHFIRHKLNEIDERTEKIMATQSDEVVELTAITTQLGSIKDGIIALETALANSGTVTPEVQTDLDNLKAASQAASDALPKPAPTPTPPPPTP